MPPDLEPYPAEDACEICGEHADDEMGEFIATDEHGETHSVIAHGQCGLDHNLPLA